MRLGDSLIGWMILASCAAILFSMFGSDWHADLSALYFAGRFYAQGAFDRVYASPDLFFGADIPADWWAEALLLGHPDATPLPYLYPPLWAALVSPLAIRVSPMAFFTVAYVIQLGFLLASVRLAHRLAGRPMTFAQWSLLSAPALIATMPSVSAFHLNQPQIAVTFLTLLALDCLNRRKFVGAGAWLGLAAALKVSPAALAVVLLSRRNRRALAAFAAVSGGLAALSLIVAGPALHRDFLAKIDLVSGLIYYAENSFALKTAIYHWTDFDRTALSSIGDYIYFGPAPAWIGPVLAAVLVAMLVLPLFTLAPLQRQPALARYTAAALIAIALTGPLSWNHYFIGPTLLLPLVFRILPFWPAALAYGFALAVNSVPFMFLLGQYPYPTIINIAPPIVVWIALYAIFALPIGRRRPT